MAEQATEVQAEQTEETPSESAPPEDDGLKKALEAERKQRKTAEVKAKELEKRLSELEPKEQQFQQRLTALENELQNERLNSVKAEVAAEKGVPVSALVGDTREDLEAFADQLLEWRGKQEKPKPTKGLKSGATSTDSSLDPMERAAAALRAYRST